MVKKGYTQTKDGQIHYRQTTGQTGPAPTVVLLHQAPASSRMFVPALQRLSGRFIAIAPDLPGFGGSFKPSALPTVEYLSSILWQALDALDVESFHLVGHHTGASIAVEMGNEKPDRIESLSLVGPPYVQSVERQERLDTLDEDKLEPPIRDDGRHLIDHWELFDDEGEDLRDQHDLAVDSLFARGSWVRTYRAIWQQDFPELFDNLTIPRMIMASPTDVLWESFLQAQEANPDVRAVELEGGNYEPEFDVERFTNALVSFIEESGA